MIDSPAAPAATLPRWDLSNVYPGLDSPELRADLARFEEEVAAFDAFFADQVAPTTAQTPARDLARLLDEGMERLETMFTRSSTMRSYIMSFVTTDSRDETAAKALSSLELVKLRRDQASTRWQSWVGRIAPALDAALAQATTAQAYRFTLHEAAERARYLMDPALEELAAELSLSGGNAWGKLQATIVSQLTAAIELDGEVKTLPMTAIINLRSHPDAAVRRRGWEVEQEAWASVANQLAACMNGIKGEVLTLARRRGRASALDVAIDQARIDQATLDAMIGAMQRSLPTFRRYLRAKARRLGQAQLAWWDLFAPPSGANRTYTYDEACALVADTFAQFAPELAALAQRAFTSNWIDVAPRPGKRAGAFCMSVAGVRESRVLLNFDGSEDSVSTLAHELGHAFHADCAFRAEKTLLQSVTPMTLAETASTLCETIVSEAMLAQVADPATELALRESNLDGIAQIIVDIYSRFLFEREVFERRAAGELSARELCDLMAQAQRTAYGDALDPATLHPYMWTWKPHYYSVSLSFYNFPYAFGQLFATGLYAIYQERGAAFVPDYMDLLASTGEAKAADLAARFGIDIRSGAFWEGSLDVVARQMARYEELVDQLA